MKRMQTTVLAAILVLWSWSTALALTFTDDATGGDCTAVGNWDAATRTCTLTQDIATAAPPANGLAIAGLGITLDCDGHMITGDGSTDLGYHGVNISVDNITVTRCEVSLFRNAIRATSQANIFTQNFFHDLRSGIVLRDSAGDNLINQNTIRDIRNGVSLLDNVGPSSITRNTIGNSRTGIFVTDSITDAGTGILLRRSNGNGDFLIGQNIVRRHFSFGVLISSGSNITVRGNVVDGSGVPKAAFERGIAVFSGSDNQILTNTILNSVIPISVIRGNGNSISENTVDTGLFGIGVDGGDFAEITDNDITGQGIFAIFVAGSSNTITRNYIHESAGIRVAFFDQLGPSNDNVVEGNIIENGTGNIFL